MDARTFIERELSNQNIDYSIYPSAAIIPTIYCKVRLGGRLIITLSLSNDGSYHIRNGGSDYADALQASRCAKLLNIIAGLALKWQAQVIDEMAC